MKEKWLPVLRTTGRILTFRATREDFESLGNRHLCFGILCTWLVGFGRTWDKPEISLLQRTGLGSVVYIFALSALLWLVVREFAAPGSSYKRILTFVSLVSPPGLIYAIPVEMFLDAVSAVTVNLTFLVIVAAWRVALLFSYMRIAEGLRGGQLLVLSLYPLAIIVIILTPFSLVAHVLGQMAGIEHRGTEREQTEKLVDQIALGIMILSWVSAPFLWPFYNAMHRNRRAMLRQTEGLKATDGPPVPSPRKAPVENPRVGDW